MITKYYDCKLLSDIVLPASSNTQGNIALLDFIAGSNFLGIVAKSYDDFGTDAFEVFHSGGVHFGDAHLTLDNQQTFKIPLSFHGLKIGDGNYNRIHLNQEKERALREEQKQLKQIRDGFMTQDLRTIFPSYNYIQKSSYDKKLRRSQDEGMYGYSGLQKGTLWRFKIHFEDEKYIELVEEKLLGEQKLGKSKSSQYGKVNITATKKNAPVSQFTPNDNITYLYALSRVVLFDEEVNPTAIPTIENLGLQSGKILWEKSYIKSSTYTPYNYKRQTKEFTRVCINKGSIIAIENCSEEIPSFVGGFWSEGFGEILINPKFLEVKEPKLTRVEQQQVSQEVQNYNETLISFLDAKDTKENNMFKVASHVNSLLAKLTGPSASQWGEIRAIASYAKNRDELITNIEEFIKNGKSKTQWEKKEKLLLKEIQNSPHPLEFVKLLSMQITKYTKRVENEK